MSYDLARFQDDFAAALVTNGGAAPAAASAVARLIDQPGFAVYRNTALKGAIDALQANYPTVDRLVGDEWFRAAAACFVRIAPPACPALIEFGAGFSDFLRDFAPAAELPYLADVARLDRLWVESHIAADAEALAPSAVARLRPEELAGARLAPHPAARWASFALPAVTIWQRNRDLRDLEAELDWVAEAALIARPEGAVEVSAIDPAACALLDACAAGQPLSAAAQAALDHAPDTNVSALLLTLLGAGAFRAPLLLEVPR